MISNPMAKLPQSRKKATTRRRAQRVLLRMEGRGMRDGWVTFKLPAWLVAFAAIALVLVCVAMIASPELAADIIALLTQLIYLPPSQRQ